MPSSPSDVWWYGSQVYETTADRDTGHALIQAVATDHPTDVAAFDSSVFGDTVHGSGLVSYAELTLDGPLVGPGITWSFRVDDDLESTCNTAGQAAIDPGLGGDHGLNRPWAPAPAL